MKAANLFLNFVIGALAAFFFWIIWLASSLPTIMTGAGS